MKSAIPSMTTATEFVLVNELPTANTDSADRISAQQGEPRVQSCRRLS